MFKQFAGSFMVFLCTFALNRILSLQGNINASGECRTMIHIFMHTFLTAKFTATITSMLGNNLEKFSSRSVTNKRGYLEIVDISFNSRNSS